MLGLGDSVVKDRDMSLGTPDLSQEQQALYDKGCKVMLPIEKKRLAKVLARHIRGGSSKYARSIPKDGVESVTLSLSCALWVVRAWGLLVVALVLLLVVKADSGLRIFGFIVGGLGVTSFILGGMRLGSALRIRKKFREAA
jgi:hypothetical protein